MRTALMLVATLVAAPLSIAAETDASAPPPSQPRYPYPKSERVIASPITDHFAFTGTFFAGTATTDLHLDSSAGVPGTLLSAEHDLGLDHRLNQAQMELIFRLRTRHRLRVNYFKSDRNGDQALTRTVSFGGETFNDGDIVQSELNLTMLSFTYTYSVIRSERFEVGAGIGLHLLDAQARGMDETAERSAQTSGSGPFPTFALDATWRISQRFAVTARGNYLSATINGISGALADYHADLQYRWTPNIVLGLGYEELQARLTVTRSSLPAGFDFRARAPEAFVRVSF
jgi:opacity protein-like surface antigen